MHRWEHEKKVITSVILKQTRAEIESAIKEAVNSSKADAKKRSNEAGTKGDKNEDFLRHFNKKVRRAEIDEDQTPPSAPTKGRYGNKTDDKPWKRKPASPKKADRATSQDSAKAAESPTDSSQPQVNNKTCSPTGDTKKSASSILDHRVQK